MAKSLEERRAQLEKRQKYLVLRLENIEDELDDTPDPDWEEQAAASESDEMLEDLGNSGQTELRAIEAALALISEEAPPETPQDWMVNRVVEVNFQGLVTHAELPKDGT